MILLDTNVASELMKPNTDAAVLSWMETQDLNGLAMTAITVEEITFGLSILPVGKRRRGMEEAFDLLFHTLPIVSFDEAAAKHSAQYRARRVRAGRVMAIPDANIAGIALAGGYGLASRDTYAFDDVRIELIDPWATP